MLMNCKELEYQYCKTYPLFTIKWYNIVDFTNHVEFIDFHIIVLLNCQNYGFVTNTTPLLSLLLMSLPWLSCYCYFTVGAVIIVIYLYQYRYHYHCRSRYRSYYHYRCRYNYHCCIIIVIVKVIDKIAKIVTITVVMAVTVIIIITINDSVTVNDADAIATALLSTLILFQLTLIILLLLILLILLILLLIQSLLLYLLLLMYVWTKYPSACCCYTCWLEVQTFIVTIVSLLVISKDYYIISYFTIILNCYVLCYCIVCSILY